MSKYYLNKARCNFGHGDNTVIYQLASCDTPRSWYIRIKKNKTGYHQESLSTSNKSLALERAQEVWFKFRNAERSGTTYGQSDFNHLFLRFLNEYTWSPSRYARVSHIFKRYLSDFFAKYEIDDIDNKLWKEYLGWRLTYWHRMADSGGQVPGNSKRKPALSTIRSERQALMQFLKWCCMHRLLPVVPQISTRLDPGTFKNINSKRSRGLPMTDKQYARALMLLRNWAIKHNDEQHWIRNFSRKRLFYFILINTSCLLRMGTEATMLKWQDLEVVDSKTRPGIKIAMWSVKSGKMGGREQPAVSTYRGLLHILRWRQICVKYGFGQDSDFVFPNHDGTRIPTFYLNKLLVRQLTKWGIVETPVGTSITLYSFRATAISRRIRKSNWDIAKIAAAANTSIATISKHYAREWVAQNPDRLADTNRGGKLYLKEAEASEIEELLGEFE